ncbi:MAG: M20/M25/M40 family metallo-hydrolase, partial [Flavobacteriaceae bacterium]|nr:M20/M25/M40 family metallo-hydrolase [Flavobacteriaceae bacterium]
ELSLQPSLLTSCLIIFFVFHKYTDLGIRLSEAEGGSLRNAIPREAHAFIAVPADKVADFEKATKEYETAMQKEFKATDPELVVIVKSVGTPKTVIVEKEATAIIETIVNCPNGVERMSESVEGLTETSNNTARIEILRGNLVVQCLTRSSSEEQKMALVEKISNNFKPINAKATASGSYPGWQPNMESPILKSMQKVYNEKYGKTPEIKAIHAGLECGLLGSVYPNWDMISFGPTIRNPHSPNEKVNIETVAKFWDFLKESLKAVPTK